MISQRAFKIQKRARSECEVVVLGPMNELLETVHVGKNRNLIMAGTALTSHADQARWLFRVEDSG